MRVSKAGRMTNSKHYFCKLENFVPHGDFPDTHAENRGSGGPVEGISQVTFYCGTIFRLANTIFFFPCVS